MAFSSKSFTIEKTYSLPIEQVWKLLSDTDRLNQMIGLFSVQFTPVTNQKNRVFYREALAKVAGFIPLRWKEYPFEWVEKEYYVVERDYETGPLLRFRGGVELVDESSDRSTVTRVRLFAEFTPRNLIGLASIYVVGLNSMKNTMKYLDDSLQFFLQGKQQPIPLKKLALKLIMVN